MRWDELDLTDDELWNTVIEVPHAFEVDLNSIVTVNHRLTLEAIARLEEYEIIDMQDALSEEDPEVFSSTARWHAQFYDDLRKAANHLALVGLVTRLQHWISRWIKERKIKVPGKHESLLIKQLGALNDSFGDAGPVPLTFFLDLVMARDSVIHADSKAEWLYNGMPRSVAGRYRNASNDLVVTEDQLKHSDQP